MFKRNKVSAGVLLAFAGIAAIPAMAQVAPQRVEITGTSIRRAEAETASPVQIITKQDIDQAGKGTVAEYLQTLTSDGQGSVPFTYGRGFSGATASGISLRGLGANATLVLINGRRVAPAVLADDAQRAFVDLNQIPMEAVERIEVLKDGASSIYGSDAVAGVVNIILKKSYVGTAIKLTYGVAQEGDGKEPRVALTHGFGDMDKDGFNVLLNAEFGKKDPIYYRDRMGRGSVGVSAIGQPQWGFNPNAGPSNNISRQGGEGWIPVNAATNVRVNNSSTPSFVGNVRNPATNDWYSRSDPAGVGFTRSFAGANPFCLANTNLPQNNTAGGCIFDMRQAVSQIQPEHETASFFGRLSKRINGNLDAFVDVGYYSSKSKVDGLPPSFSGGYFTPGGVVVSRAATTLLGAAHPDNPYFGTAARLQYRPYVETGPAYVEASSHSSRMVAGLKGVWGAWDFDSALSYSEAKQTDTSSLVFERRTLDALLNPTAANVAAATAFNPAYAALPAGTYLRIGENAKLNSAAVYNALYASKQREGFARQYGADFKATREIGKLDGGPIGIAVGVEARHEANNLPLYSGLGDYVGLSLTAYGGKRDIYAVFTEVLLPVTKQFELNAALRYDNYSDSRSSTTPKIGAKWTPMNNLAFRGTYAEGFRAPSSTENSATSVAGFGGATINDNVRCAALTAGGLALSVVNANCKGIAPTFLQRGNPNLEPEKSESMTMGLVWDITPRTSITTDLWQIKRKGLPVIEVPQAAVDAGRVTRDTSSPLVAGDPGGILSGSVVFVNSAKSLTQGVDIEVKHRWDMGANGKLTTGLTWTHQITQRVTDADGTIHDYAGTHGDCHVTNCMGSPKDRLSFAGTWEKGAWRFGANVNYRGAMSNKEEESMGCAQTLLSGADAPAGCKIKSFATMDISGAYKIGKKTEVFGSVANLFDTKPPSDFLTYGAIGYNALDYSGAIGRMFRVGLKHQF